MASSPWPRRLATTALVLSSAAAQANSYTIVDLGAKIHPVGIDESGQIAGTLYFRTHRRSHGPQERAQVYEHGKWRQELPWHASSQAMAIRAGRVAGMVDGRPVLWEHRYDPIFPALPGGATFGWVTGIDAAGDVSGYVDLADGEHCFAWSIATGTSQDLGFLKDGDRCNTGGMDHQGRVFGFSTEAPGGPGRAFVWKDGRMQGLPELTREGSAIAVAGNLAGMIVGWAISKDADENYQHAVAWHDGVVEDLTPGCCFETRANAIDEGTIIGRFRRPAGDDPRFFAVRFEARKAVLLQNELVNRGDWEILYDATGVSGGVIVGDGIRADGKTHGFMLIPQ